MPNLITYLFDKTWYIWEYELPSYTSSDMAKELRAFFAQNGAVLLHYRNSSYSFYDDGVFFKYRAVRATTSSSGSPNLVFYYNFSKLRLTVLISDILYKSYKGIHCNFLVPYVNKKAGRSINNSPFEFHCTVFNEAPLKKFLFSRKQLPENAAGSRDPNNPDISANNIISHISEKVAKVNVSSQEIFIPRGAFFKDKRSRTIEHEVSIDWNSTITSNLNAGIRDLISGSIQSEMGKSNGINFKQSETIEKEVTLDGNISSKYKIEWFEIWREGYVEVVTNEMTWILPFRIKVDASLEVNPILK